MPPQGRALAQEYLKSIPIKDLNTSLELLLAHLRHLRPEASSMTGRVPVGVFFALFTVSGFAGLIYQSIWSHYLKLFLGHAAYAQTLVLAIFMGGMALGAWLVSRYTHRIRNLLLGYAIAELGIGMLAIAFHRVFLGATGWAFDTVLPALGGGGVDAFKWSLASLLILPASILLGHDVSAHERGRDARLSRRGRPGAVDAVLHQQLRRRLRRARERVLPDRQVGLPGHDPGGRASRTCCWPRSSGCIAKRLPRRPGAPEPMAAGDPRGAAALRPRDPGCSLSRPARRRSSTRSPGSAC